MADGHIVLDTRVDTKGIKNGFSEIAAAGKSAVAMASKGGIAIASAAAVAIGTITKKAVDSYADWEQLLGGVETLFKNSSQKVINYANEAYKTVGISANEYMRNVTAFSAALLQSLGGDTEKAADVANMALTDIADNVNKMGSSYESVQLAFQGFAKQQYMLLDNLKLGYGGTKTEMERLLKDAQKITGIKYDISNLSDVYSAIHVIQAQLGITGTTAKEAATTIQGSAAMMKAAYENVLTAIGGGGDIDAAVDNLIYSLERWFDNIIPTIERSLVGIGKAIERIAPKLVQMLTTAIIKSIPALINAVIQMVIGAVRGIVEGIKALFTGVKADDVVSDVEKTTGNILENVGKTATEEKKATEEAKKQLAAFDEIQTLSTPKTESSEDVSIPAIGGVASQIEGIEKGITSATDGALEKFKKWLLKFKPVVDKISEFVKPAADNVVTIFTDMWSSLESAWEKRGKPVIEEINKAVESNGKILETWWENLFKPIWESLNKNISELWEKHLRPLFGSISDLNWAIVDFFVSIWNTWFAPFFTWLGEKTSWLGVTADKIITGLQEILGVVVDFTKGTIDGLTGLIDFLTGVFTLDWEKATKGLSEMWASVWGEDGMAKAIEDGLNMGIDLINKFLKLMFDSFQWVVNGLGKAAEGLGKMFGKDWGWNISLEPWQIPKLGAGRVTPSSAAVISSVGAGLAGADLGYITRAINEAMEARGVGGGTFVIELDGREVGRTFGKAIATEQKRAGKSLVKNKVVFG